MLILIAVIVVVIAAALPLVFVLRGGCARPAPRREGDRGDPR